MAWQRLERKRREIEELARGWGGLLAREAYPDGVGLEVALFALEELAVTAARALVRGTVETLTANKPWGWEASIPALSAASPVPGSIVPERSRFAAAAPRSRSRWPIARLAVGIFFLLRPHWKMDAHPYSPTLLHRMTLMAGTADSCEVAAVALEVVGEMRISARRVNNIAARIGGQLAADRDARGEHFVRQPLPREATRVMPAPQLAAVFRDAGRMRTRAPGGGHGVHRPRWRETKNAAFHRMKSDSHAVDPQPTLPSPALSKSASGSKGPKILG